MSRKAPSQTYAARLARGRVPVTVYLSPDRAAMLAEVAEATGGTKGDVVGAALEEYAERHRL